MVSDKRKKAKTDFLKVLYGGKIKRYSSFYDNETEGNITKEGFEFLKELQKEVETLMLLVWDQNAYLHDLKTGQDKKIQKNQTLKRH